MSEYKLVIPGNTPSLKNSKQIFHKWITDKKTGQRKNVPFVTSSEQHKKWYPQAFEEVNNSPLVLKEWNYPLRISFHFIRETKETFDWINVAQAPLDLLKNARIIEEDDMLHVIPGDWSYEVHPGAACCILTIEEYGNSN